MGFYQVEIFGFMVLLINDWNSVIGASFNVVNQCVYTVWPGIRGNPGSSITSTTGFELLQGNSRSFQVPAGWSGRLWGRTGCNFKDSKNTSCTTGDCGSGQLECNGSQAIPPATLAEFSIGSGFQDFYDISLVDGFNLPILVEAIGGGGGSGSCASTGCTQDLNQKCPTELRAAGGSACKSACEAFGTPMYCCTGDYASSTKCVPTNYSNFFKSSCPTSYSYAYDDDASAFSCTAANYTITFCPIVRNAVVVAAPSNSPAPSGLVLGPAPSNSPPAPSGLVLGPVPSNSPPAPSGLLSGPAPPDIRGDRVFPKSRKKLMPVPLRILIIALIVVAVILLVVAFVSLRRSKKKRLSSKDEEDISLVESLNYSLKQVQNATNNFSEDCKIGQGGFGLVYKGTLPNKQEVAVKRLSKTSTQGLEEFKNEILLLAKLQHKNLVRLLGFCFENQEMILIYEFFRNKSLDNFLFDPEKRRPLDWRTRHVIIEGIARGLLYLHEDSRLRIIHRDLKASNVLLDDNMNPKIADFGTARLLQLDQSQENTRRIAGTYGYMAPEYAIYGQISVKSDVFSFGVLLLEIISGQKNNTFYQSNGVDDLRSYAWKNFMNGIPLALLDPSVGELYSRNEVIHCIHVGLLCVQEDPQARPTMASVVIMLSSSSVTLPIPLQPGFFAATHAGTGNVMQPELPCSVSERDASFTELFPR